MTKLLAIETSTDCLGVAAAIGADRVHRDQSAPRAHARLLLDQVDQILAEIGLRLSALDGIVVGAGPGSFTGIRIGVAAAQGLAFGAGLPLLGISSLASMARAAVLGGSADADQNVLAAFDARMGEVYCGIYAAGAPETRMLVAERVIAPHRLGELHITDPVIGVGEGFSSYGEQIAKQLGDRLLSARPAVRPAAAATLDIAIARLARGSAQWTTPEQFEPTYLRDRVAEPAPSS